MAGSGGPGETGGAGSGDGRAASGHDEDLERRRRDLEASLAAVRSGARSAGQGAERGGGVAGYGQAFRLSSEFIAGIAVGAGLGWVIDSVLGTSPWGLIVFLLLGFAAGVLNVLRSAGMVAQTGPRPPGEGDREADRE